MLAGDGQRDRDLEAVVGRNPRFEAIGVQQPVTCSSLPKHAALNRMLAALRSVGMLGYALLTLAVLLFLGLADFLPLDLWLWFHQLWSGQSGQVYVRVVPKPEPDVLPCVLLGIGIAAVALGSMLKARGKQR